MKVKAFYMKEQILMADQLFHHKVMDVLIERGINQKRFDLINGIFVACNGESVYFHFQCWVTFAWPTSSVTSTFTRE